MKYAIFTLVALVAAGALAKTSSTGADPDAGVAFYDLHNKRHVIAEKPATNYALLNCNVYVLSKMSERKHLSKHDLDDAKRHHVEIIELDKPATARAFSARYGKLTNGSIKQLETNISKMQGNVIKDMGQRGYSMEDLPKFIDVCYYHATMLGKFYKE